MLKSLQFVAFCQVFRSQLTAAIWELSFRGYPTFLSLFSERELKFMFAICHRSLLYFSACTMSSQRKFTFAISSPDEFLVAYGTDGPRKRREPSTASNHPMATLGTVMLLLPTGVRMIAFTCTTSSRCVT